MAMRVEVDVSNLTYLPPPPLPDIEPFDADDEPTGMPVGVYWAVVLSTLVVLWATIVLVVLAVLR